MTNSTIWQNPYPKPFGGWGLVWYKNSYTFTWDTKKRIHFRKNPKPQNKNVSFSLGFWIQFLIHFSQIDLIQNFKPELSKPHISGVLDTIWKGKTKRQFKWLTFNDDSSRYYKQPVLPIQIKNTVNFSIFCVYFW